MPPTNETRRALLAGAAGLGNLSRVVADGFENKQDRSCAQAESRVAITLGDSKSCSIWKRRWEGTFDELAEKLSKSPPGPKDGACFTPAVFAGETRNLNQATRIDIAVLDADCGHSFDEVRDAVENAGYAAIIHATHSHLTTETKISVSSFEKSGSTDVSAFMREKKSFLPRVVEGAKIFGKSRDGANFIVAHNPCPRFRVIIPLSEPWRASDFKDQDEANAIWRVFIAALASALGLQADQSCSDTSRLFFFPRTRRGGPEYQFKHVRGNPCDLRATVAAAQDEGLFNPGNARAKESTSAQLLKWAATHAVRFEIVVALESRSPGRLKRLHGVKQAIECPFEDEHTTPGGEGTFAVNASQLAAAGLPQITSGFVLKCSHNACAGRDRLDLLAGMLTQGWLAESDLTEPEFVSAGPGSAAHGLSRPYEPIDEDAFDAAILRLAALSAAAYERVRADEAKRLGVRVTALDKLVAAERKEDCMVGQGKQLELPEPEPWPEPVDGAALISELEAAINRYVVLPKDAAFTCALWVLHAHCFDTFTCTPRLAITAPEKRCGKTTLLDVIGELVSRPLPTANITAAAVFRTIEVKRPVMLIDEADTFVGESEDLRGILNSGHRRGGQVIRTVGDDHDPRAFSTFCPVAIAQIGKLPSTLADRSIGIEMRRRTSSEKVMRFRNGRTQELGQLARMAARWVADNDGAIGEREPDIPKSIFNRAADNWEPLLAIAEVAGARIAEHARQVALAACGGEDEQSLGVMLLTDIREAFGTKKEIASVALVAALVAMCDRPWGECNRGKVLTQNWLARRLKPFGVHPKNVGPKRDQAKGYTLESFADAFKRYIHPDSTVHPYTANKNTGLDENQTVHQTNGWTDANVDNQLNSNEVYGSTVENLPNVDSRECADDLPPGNL